MSINSIPPDKSFILPYYTANQKPSEDYVAPALPADRYSSRASFEFEQEAIFSVSWLCVGRTDQIPLPGDYFSVTIANEPIIVVRGKDNAVRVLSAVCRHRGHVLAEDAGNTRLFTCPLHHWTFDTMGALVGAPRMDSLDALKAATRLPEIRSEHWHGFVFINFDDNAEPLAPSLSKVEECWAGFDDIELVTLPPHFTREPLPWNWKVQFENFTDAYHPEFVHPTTHSFAPSQGASGGVEFTRMTALDNCIMRGVSLLEPDGGMTEKGWGPEAVFPPISSLSDFQRSRITFAMIPPTITLIFSPSVIGYSLIYPIDAERTLVAGDRLTAGGWILPKSTVDLPDFDDRCEQYREGSRTIGDEDVPVNMSLQMGKHSRFVPDNHYGPLERTLEQFNAWLNERYRRYEH